jgi:hypothetical protein
MESFGTNVLNVSSRKRLMKILGVDPGKTTGLALIEVVDRRMQLLATTQSRDSLCLDWLELLKSADLLAVESFQLRPQKARTGSFDWSDMLTPQVIGSIRTLAAMHGKELELQSPSVKPMGYAWSGQKYVAKKPGTHQQDALAHATYYAVKHMKAVPASAP